MLHKTLNKKPFLSIFREGFSLLVLKKVAPKMHQVCIPSQIHKKKGEQHLSFPLSSNPIHIIKN